MTPLPLGNLAAAALQAGLIALAGAPLPRLFGIWSPRARLAYWRALMLTCVLVPLLAPRVAVPAPGPPAAVVVPGEAIAVGPAALGAVSPVAGAPATWVSRMRSVSLSRIVVAGILLRLLWLSLGLAMLTRLRNSARRLWPRPPAVDDAVSAAGADAEFLVSGRAWRPMTFGVLRPVILVPGDFTEFTPEQQKAIACHELLHVRRLDWLRTAADELVRTFAWFHPAAWWLTGQIHLSREQLVDEQVVRHLGARRPYLDALLHLASSERRGGLLPASLFLGRAHLPQRVALLVKEVRMSRLRLGLSFAAIAALLGLGGHAAVAAFPLHASLDGPPAVQAVAQAARPGFPTAAPPQAKPPVRTASYPHRVKDVRPVFPSDAAVEGAWPWLFEFTLDANGNVQDVTSLSSATNRFVEAAIDAIRQWKFTPPPTAPFKMQVGLNLAAGRGELASQPPVLVGGNVKPPVKNQGRQAVLPAGRRGGAGAGGGDPRTARRLGRAGERGAHPPLGADARPRRARGGAPVEVPRRPASRWPSPSPAISCWTRSPPRAWPGASREAWPAASPEG